ELLSADPVGHAVSTRLRLVSVVRGVVVVYVLEEDSSGDLVSVGSWLEPLSELLIPRHCGNHAGVCGGVGHLHHDVPLVGHKVSLLHGSGASCRPDREAGALYGCPAGAL